MESGKEERISWWLWPNVLSLDAPMVAVVWLFAFSQAYDFAVEWPVYLVLFLAVWCIYLGDRLFDNWRPDLSEAPVTRRRFVRQHFGWLKWVMAFLVPVTGVVAALTLPAAVLRNGAFLGILVGIYFVVFVSRRAPGKEVAAGFMFAIGAVVPAMGDIERFPDRWVPALLIFGLVSGYNCFLIDRNERKADRKELGMRDATMLGIAAFAVAMVPAAWQRETAWIYFSLAISAALLTALQYGRARVSRDAFRVLADVALLTPLLWLPFLA